MPETISETITIRIPKEVKGLMQASEINWSEDIRSYIEARVKSLKLYKLLKTMRPVHKRKGSEDSTSLIREWRDIR